MADSQFNTPNKSKRSSTPQKSPQKTPLKSPHSNVNPMADELVQRRLSDILVGFHKCIQTWDTYNLESFNTATTLCNLYSQWYQIEDKSSTDLDKLTLRKYYVKLGDHRESLLEQLKSQHLKFRNNYEKLTSYVYNIKSIYYANLSSILQSEEDSIEVEKKLPPIFQTWSSKDFFQTTKEIFEMYNMEYLLKELLFKKVFDFRLKKNSDTGCKELNLCLPIWLHQPNILETAKFLLDSMLIEANLK